MGTGQMLLVMLAVILFSTILLTMYTNLDAQNRVIERTKNMLQCQKIADNIFQRIDSQLIGELRNFSQIHSDYLNYTRTMIVNQDTFHITCVRAAYCDQTGGTPVATTDYQLIELSMWTRNTFGDSVVVGTASNPLQKVFADMDL